ncbi:primase-helicase family protein [Pseudoalteromonas rubra]|uniref:primase-helicase family protein n=1 Tax=Pseudoalteromonas rubra TaxID=43658 RepID=UPI002DBD87D5|nr:primase-helicase family protein [Pseudoalteromonas rubra]MEC4091690.1 primase-helicase family protein [Pseudoalteromonas rubra]
MNSHQKFIAEHTSEIEEIVAYWIPRKSAFFQDKYRDVTRWLCNFRPNQCKAALTLLENIDYINDDEMRDYVNIAAKHIKKIFRDDLKDVLFYPLELSSAASGSQFLYQYGKELGLKEKNFKSDDFRAHLNRDIDIVFFDDIIGSGNQATKFFNNYLKNARARCHYVALLGFENGQENIRRDTNFNSLLVIRTLYDECMAFSDNSQVFTTQEEKELVKAVCLEWGKKLYPAHPLGYDDSQALIVMPHNTPNNTLPVVWAGPDSESYEKQPWHPVWPRKKLLKKKTKSLDPPGASVISESFFEDIAENFQGNFAPYHFYTAKLKDDCQWYGIAQRWDIRRSIEADIEQQIIKSFHDDVDMRVASVVSGAGGSGKSTLLRRIAFNLSKSEYTVIWLEDIDDFFINAMLDIPWTQGKYLVFIEDWYRFSDNSNHLNELFNALSGNRSVRLVIGDRFPEQKPYLKYLFNPDNNLYSLKPDENHDLLSAIVERMPQWSSTHEIMSKKEDYSKSSLFLLLFILARTAGDESALFSLDCNLMSHYRAIIQSDIKKIYEQHSALAKALVYWSWLYKNNKTLLHEKDFCYLADFFDDSTKYGTYFSLEGKGEVNERLQSYINKSSENFLSFNHDTLAEEGISYAIAQGMDESHFLHRQVLDMALERFSDRVISGLLLNRLCEEGFFKSKSEKLSYIEQLDKRGCTSDGYLHYLIKCEDFNRSEKIINAVNLLERKSALPVLSQGTMCSCLNLLQGHESGQQQALRLLERDSPETPLNSEVTSSCLRLLKGHESGQEQALRLLERDSPETQLRPNVTSSCLKLLQGLESGREQALRLLQRDSPETSLTPQVICSCLKLLKGHQSGQEQALRLLGRDSPETPLSSEVTCGCLKLLQGLESGREQALRLLQRDSPETPLSSEVTCSCLKLLEGHQSGLEQALHLLERDSAETPLDHQIVSSCLNLLQGHHSGQEQALRLLERDSPETPLGHQTISSCLNLLQGLESGQQQALRLLERDSPETPLGSEVTCSCLKLLQGHQSGQEQALRLLERDSPETPLGHQTISSCLNLLQGHESGQQQALRLLEKDSPETPLNLQVICSCLKLLQGHKSGQEQALRLLERDSPETPLSPQVISSCLREVYAHPKAKQYVIRLFQEQPNWRQLNWYVVYYSLVVHAQFELYTPVVAEIISEYNPGKTPRHVFNRYIQVLKMPFFHDQVWVKTTQSYLDNWQESGRLMLISVLEAYQSKPELTINTCQQILKFWEGEINYRRYRDKKAYTWKHIALAMDHPSLSKEARAVAREMIAYDSNYPETLPSDLLLHCEQYLKPAGV